MPALTSKTISSTPAPTAGATRLWDDQVPGLHLEVRSSGTRTYRLRYREQTGRQRTLKIGKVGEVTHGQARKVARQHMARVRLGESPAAELEEARQAPKLDDIASRSLDDAINLKPQTLRDYQSQYRRYIKPTLGQRTVQSIDRGEVARVLDGVPGHVNRNRVRALFSRIMAHAMRRGHIDRNPVQAIPKAREQGREEYLTADQLRDVWQACEDEREDPMGAAVIQLLMLTGARKREALRSQWADFDLQSGKWSKPQATSKSGKRHVVYLDAEAVGLLQRLAASSNGPCVFPSNTHPDRPRVDMRKVWTRVQRRAGLQVGYRLHDLRHSYCSMLAANGATATAIQQLVGHSSLAVTQKYCHGHEDSLRRTVDAHGMGNVVSLEERRKAA